MSESLTCPSCRAPMAQENFVSLWADVCTSCFGIWFDAGELEKVDHKTKGFGAALDRAAARPGTGDREQDVIDCPRCHVPLDATEYEGEKSVVIDECNECDGVFLDAGELQIIRLRDQTPAEQAKVHRRRRKRRARAQRKDDEIRRIRRALIHDNHWLL